MLKSSGWRRRLSLRAFRRLDFWRENTLLGATFDIKVNSLSINITWLEEEIVEDDEKMLESPSESLTSGWLKCSLIVVAGDN